MGTIVSAPPLGVKNIALVSNQYLTSIVNAVGTQAQPAASNLSNGVTGSGAVVLATSPALTTATITTSLALTGAAAILAQTARCRRLSHTKALTDNTLTNIFSITLTPGYVCMLSWLWFVMPAFGFGSSNGAARGGRTNVMFGFESDSGAFALTAVTDEYSTQLSHGSRTEAMTWSTDGGTVGTGVVIVKALADDSGNGTSNVYLWLEVLTSDPNLVVTTL